MLVPNKWLPWGGLLFKIQFHSSHLYIVPPPQTQPKMCSRNIVLSRQVITHGDNIFLKLIKIKNLFGFLQSNPQILPWIQSG